MTREEILMHERLAKRILRGRIAGEFYERSAIYEHVKAEAWERGGRQRGHPAS